MVNSIRALTSVSRARRVICSSSLWSNYLTEHGDGSHFEPSGSFLKFSLVFQSIVRYVGSSTIEVTTIHCWPCRSFCRSQYSVSTASALYGTPFFRKYPGRKCFVTTLRLPNFVALSGCWPRGVSHCATESPCHV